MLNLKISNLILIIGAILLLSGCANYSYKPSVSLGVSQTTINAKVKMEKFFDNSPSSDKESPLGCISATSPDTLSGDLDNEVTDAILMDFNNNQVFDEVKKKMDRPDLILQGTINRYYGTAGVNAGLWLTIPIYPIWFLGIPIQSDKGLIDLTLSAYKSDRTLIKEYTAKCEFGELYSIYTSVELGLQTRLNKCLSDVVKQLREGLIADEKLFQIPAVSITSTN